MAVKKNSNKPKVGMAVWTSLHSSHNIKGIMGLFIVIVAAKC